MSLSLCESLCVSVSVCVSVCESVSVCVCVRALRAVLRSECGHSALNGFHSQNLLLEVSGESEAVI